MGARGSSIYRTGCIDARRHQRHCLDFTNFVNFVGPTQCLCLLHLLQILCNTIFMTILTHFPRTFRSPRASLGCRICTPFCEFQFHKVRKVCKVCKVRKIEAMSQGPKLATLPRTRPSLASATLGARVVAPMAPLRAAAFACAAPTAACAFACPRS